MSVRMVRLEEVCEVNPRAPKNIKNDAAVSFIPMSAVSEDGHIFFEEARTYGDVKKGYTYFERGDVLVAKITPCFENGKAASTETIQNKLGFGSTEFHVLRPSKDLDPKYVFYLIWSERFRKIGEKGMTGSAGQKRVPADLLRRLEIPLPSLDEQKRIAAILDKADALRAKRRQAIALLDSLTQSIFLEMFGQGNPRWPNVELKDAVKQGTIVTYGIVQAGDEFEGGVPYIRTGDIQGGEIVCEHLRHTAPKIAAKFSRSRVEAGDIVMSIRATVGTTALVPAELEGANLTQGTARIAPGADLEADYFLYYLRSDPVQAWIQRQVKGATFREITLARLRELNVVVPPVDLQREFTAAMRKIRHMKSKLTDAIAASDTLFSSLQHRAFTGQL